MKTLSRFGTTREVLGCHPGCVTFEAVHKTEVNRTSSPRHPWRSECHDCGTVIALHPTRSLAVLTALGHAKRPEENPPC